MYHFRRDSNILGLLTKMQDKHGLPCDFTIAATEKSTRRCWVFVFDRDENSAIELVERTKRGNIAHKVKVRMVADRLDKTEGYLEGKLGIKFSKDLLTLTGLANAIRISRKLGHGYNGEIPWFLKDIKEMVDREDMDQRVYDEAWDLHKVREVMNT
jgi:hypothetical protein